MKFVEQLEKLYQNLIALDARKQMAIGIAMLVSLTTAIFLNYQFGKPLTTPLYSDLSREDLNSMSRILSENGMEFVVESENGSIAVSTTKIAQARMLLAEHGLPTSQESGYELFDRVNTLGLTSFMQGVTNKRAIEGELVRTIQMINGVNSARVHLVMQEKKVFGRNRSAPSTASVVLKTYGKIPARSINAIRHMVSAAVPSLEANNVTIIGSDGTLMTAKNDAAGGSSSLVELEKEYERDIESKIMNALGAHLGNENLRVSATVKLNNDQRRVNETVYDPDSRVERSVQVVREIGTTENKESSAPTTVDQNLPDEEVTGAAGQLSLENSERREELTNYEINEKKVSVVSDGYVVENLSIAIVVNTTRLEELIEGDPTQQQIALKSAELKGIAQAAISISEERGDNLIVNLVEFMPIDDSADDSASNPIMTFFAMHFGAIVNMIGLIVAALLFAVLGLRPVLAILNKEPSTSQLESNLGEPMQLDDTALSSSQLLTSPAVNADQPDESVGNIEGPEDISHDKADWESDLSEVVKRETQMRDKLGVLVAQGEQRAATIIKNWLQETETT